jgi:hypothetical protein
MSSVCRMFNTSIVSVSFSDAKFYDSHSYCRHCLSGSASVKASAVVSVSVLGVKIYDNQSGAREFLRPLLNCLPKF